MGEMALCRIGEWLTRSYHAGISPDRIVRNASPAVITRNHDPCHSPVSPWMISTCHRIYGGAGSGLFGNTIQRAGIIKQRAAVAEVDGAYILRTGRRVIGRQDGRCGMGRTLYKRISH
ncbi:hypothetical protein BGC30_08580 [Novacetimonas hansenii]|nr:hypothetical protein BGC30_08580 [Novacetimonas hansenii]